MILFRLRVQFQVRFRTCNETQYNDIQVEHFKIGIENLETRLKGEKPERGLYAILRKAFPDDKFERPKMKMTGK